MEGRLKDFDQNKRIAPLLKEIDQQKQEIFILEQELEKKNQSSTANLRNISNSFMNNDKSIEDAKDTLYLDKKNFLLKEIEKTNLQASIIEKEVVEQDK